MGKDERPTFEVTIVVELWDDLTWLGGVEATGSRDIKDAVDFALSEASWRADKFIKKMRKIGLSA